MTSKKHDAEREAFLRARTDLLWRRREVSHFEFDEMLNKLVDAARAAASEVKPREDDKNVSRSKQKQQNESAQKSASESKTEAPHDLAGESCSTQGQKSEVLTEVASTGNTEERNDIECAYCGGCGYTVGSQAGCCGHPTGTGECCGQAIEEQCQLQCEACGGCGKLPVVSASPSSPVTLSEEQVVEIKELMIKSLANYKLHQGRFGYKAADIVYAVIAPHLRPDASAENTRVEGLVVVLKRLHAALVKEEAEYEANQGYGDEVY